MRAGAVRYSFVSSSLHKTTRNSQLHSKHRAAPALRHVRSQSIRVVPQNPPLLLLLPFLFPPPGLRPLLIGTYFSCAGRTDRCPIDRRFPSSLLDRSCLVKEQCPGIQLFRTWALGGPRVCNSSCFGLQLPSHRGVAPLPHVLDGCPYISYMVPVASNVR